MTNSLALQHNKKEKIHQMYKTYTLSFERLQDTPLSQRHRTAGWVSYAQHGRVKLVDNIYGHYRSSFNNYGVIGRQSNRTQ